MNILIADAFSQSLCDDPDSLVIHDFQAFPELLRAECTEIIAHEAVHMLFQGTDGLHQGTLEVVTDTHDFTGSLHLGSQSSLRRQEFVEG